MRRFGPCLIFVLLAGGPIAGCTGDLASTGDDGGVTPRDGDVGRDAGDAGSPDEDAGSPDDAGMSDDGGGPGDAGGTDSGPPGPCEGVSCAPNESCDAATGSCVCNPGFMREGGSCLAIDPGDPAGRSTDEVCAQWNDGHVTNASPAWTEGDTMCDPGTLAPEAIPDTLRRINMFRWLVGLPPVTDDPAQHAADQQCAVMMYANGDLNHEPPESWDCYTSEGAGAASSSNLALGPHHPAHAIKQNMADRRTMSLGHRRWIMNFSLGKVGVGHAGNANCLGVFDGSGSTDRQWAAYPPPGPAPSETASFTWHFQAQFALSDATVTVVRESDGMELAVSSYMPRGGFYMPAAIAWTPSGWTPASGETYRVTIGGIPEGPITYSVQVVGC